MKNSQLWSSEAKIIQAGSAIQSEFCVREVGKIAILPIRYL